MAGLEKGSDCGHIDLLWPGLFMANKIRGRDFDEATQQSIDYVQVLE